jgi:hypothetical protein
VGSAGRGAGQGIPHAALRPARPRRLRSRPRATTAWSCWCAISPGC